MARHESVNYNQICKALSFNMNALFVKVFVKFVKRDTPCSQNGTKRWSPGRLLGINITKKCWERRVCLRVGIEFPHTSMIVQCFTGFSG